MRVLVTGGASFLVSHLVDYLTVGCRQRLMANGDDVICLDDSYTGNKQNIIKWFVGEPTVGNRPNFEFIRHDITEPIRLEVDQIYHLACPASPVHYQFNPIETIKTSVLGTMDMLGLAKRVKARFFLASISEVYGDLDVHLQTRSFNQYN